MLSIIICSRDNGLLTSISDSISGTVGVEYELLVYDNKQEGKGICEVYNELALKARFDILCFVHEDVLFKTDEWGKILVNTFQRENAGVIGIAGSKYKSQYCSGWFTNNRPMDCATYIHQYPDRLEKVVLRPNKQSSFEEVVCIDGVFISCTKSVWNEIKFSSQIKGFHFYDIDFSLRASQKFIVGVLFDLQLIHITSGGDYGNRWVIDALHYHKIHKRQLPFSKWNVTFQAMNKNLVLGYLDFLKNYKISARNKYRWIVEQKLFLYPIFYISIMKFFLYEPLGLKKIFRKKAHI